MTHAEKKIRLGRPPSPPNKVRGNRVVTFVTDSDLFELTRLSEADGLSISAVCYQMINESLKRMNQDPAEARQGLEN
jgi:hypothetical protein